MESSLRRASLPSGKKTQALAAEAFVLLAFTFSSLTLSPLVEAETREIYGLPFSVGDYQELDSSTVRIVLNGEERLLSKEAVTASIIEGGFAKPDAFPPENIHRFILLALRAGDNESALKGLVALSRVRSDDQAAYAYTEEFLQLPRGAELIELAVKRLSHHDLPFGLMIAYGISDPELRWAEISSHIRKDLPRFRTFCEARLLELYEGRRVPDASKVIELMRQVLGVEDPIVAKWNGVEVGVVNAFSSERRGDIVRFYPLFDLISDDPKIAGALHPLVMELVIKEAQFLLSKSKSEEALLILSRLDINRRTPNLHESLLGVLSALPIGKFMETDDAGIESMLKGYSRVDPKVHAAYTGMLADAVRTQLERNNFARADQFFQRLREVNPDPHTLNDSLRVTSALALLSEGRKASAERKLSAVETGLSLGQWIRLFIAGRYLRIDWLLMLLAIPGIGLLLYRALNRILQQRAAAKEEEERSKPEEVKPLPEDEDDGPLQRRFVDMKYRQSMNPRMQEYQQLLRVFKLEPGASFAEIKSAYRNLAKANHPDASKEVDIRASDDFIKIKTTYERILAVRKELGMPVD